MLGIQSPVLRSVGEDLFPRPNLVILDLEFSGYLGKVVFCSWIHHRI